MTESYKREHNFYEVVRHPKLKPGYRVWRCDDCETEILLLQNVNQREVNRAFANKMLCIKPGSGNAVQRINE